MNQITMRPTFLLTVVLALVCGCASYESTVDTSRTLRRGRAPVALGRLVLAPVSRDLGPPGFAERLQTQLHQRLRRQLPGVKVIAWHIYERHRHEPAGGSALHVLRVRDLRLHREQRPPEDAVARCDYGRCWGPRPPHVWRSDVEVLVELRDARRSLVWRGVGGARSQHPGERSIDMKVLVAEGETVPPLDALALDVVDQLAEGVAREIAALRGRSGLQSGLSSKAPR